MQGFMSKVLSAVDSYKSQTITVRCMYITLYAGIVGTHFFHIITLYLYNILNTSQSIKYIEAYTHTYIIHVCAYMYNLYTRTHTL